MKKYLIDVQPIKISNRLHMNNIANYCYTDFTARYQRDIKGKDLVYPFCYDNNGPETEEYAHKHGILNKKNIIQFSHEKSIFHRVLSQNLGLAHSHHYYDTFNPVSIKLAEKSFKDLISKNLCYKTKEGWFIDIKNHYLKIKESIEKIIWVPEKPKYAILDEIKEDWLISSDSKFGIPIPDDDYVFDPSHISSLSPSIAWTEEHLIADKKECKVWEPSLECPIFNIRFQNNDYSQLLFVIIKSLYHNNQIPWEKVVITNQVLDENEKIISKSAGNYISPVNYIKTHTSDGIRFWTTQTNKIDTSIMDKAKLISTKIKDSILTNDIPDNWNEIKTNVEKNIENFEYKDACNKLIDFLFSKETIYKEVILYIGIFLPNTLTDLRKKLQK